ncbi:hypothetical protein [Polaromonas sp. P5_D5]
MCSPVETIVIWLFVGMFACGVFGYGDQCRFEDYIEEHHPTRWKELALRSKWLMPENGEHSQAGVQWFLILHGEYKKIEDPRAQTLGRKARIWSMTGLVCLASVGLYALVVQNFPSLRCLIPWM